MIWDSVLNAELAEPDSLELRDRSAAPSGSRRHIPRPASGSSVPDRSTADPWTNNEVQVRCGARKDREQYRSSVPGDLRGLRHRAEIGRKAALVRSSGVPSWLAPNQDSRQQDGITVRRKPQRTSATKSASSRHWLLIGLSRKMEPFV